jgi:hypothetical protein
LIFFFFFFFFFFFSFNLANKRSRDTYERLLAEDAPHVEEIVEDEIRDVTRSATHFYAGQQKRSDHYYHDYP